LRVFLKDFVVGIVALPLATLAAVGISYFSWWGASPSFPS
jgi:hypothetical protein